MKVSNKRKGCPVVSLSAGSMMTGDTVTVTIAKKLEDGTIVAYPAGTEFILNPVKGESYGTLVESGGNWPDGFEKSFYDFVYAKWNKKESYRKEVFQKSRHYLPQE